jgi:hypothetical protein
MCGVFVRRCWLPSDAAGRNAGDNARKNASGNARARRWSLQAAPVVTPRRAAVTPRRAAVTPRYPAPALFLISLAPVSVSRAGLSPQVARYVGQAGGRAGRWNMDGSSLREGNPFVFGADVRRYDTVKQGVYGYPLVLARMRRKSPECAQGPSARRLVTVGGMNPATQNAPRRTRRALAPPRWAPRARTCPAVAKPAQGCPRRTVALTVQGRTRDNAARAVRHDGGPRSWGRAVVDGTRSASPLRAPGVRAARLHALAASGLSLHGVMRPGDRCAASHREQSGEFQP